MLAAATSEHERAEGQMDRDNPPPRMPLRLTHDETTALSRIEDHARYLVRERGTRDIGEDMLILVEMLLKHTPHEHDWFDGCLDNRLCPEKWKRGF